MVSEASGSTGTTQEPYTYFNHQQQPEPRGRAPRSNRASKRSSTVIDSCKSSGHAHGPYTRPHIPSSAQCYRANGCRGTRAADSGSGEERAAMALTALQCTAPCSVHLSATVATCRPDAEEDGALGRRKAFDASTRVTHACTEAAALPTSEKKHCMQMMCCAPQARKICTKKVKVVPK